MKKRKPGLILCDVDGTLIDPTQAITPAFDELRQLLSQTDAMFSIASGRSLELLQMYIDKLDIQAPVLINNGAGARQNGTVLWDTFFPPMLIKDAVRKADRMDMAIFQCFSDHELVYRHNAYIQNEMDTYGRYNHFYIPLESEWPELKLERVMITDPQRPGRIDEIMPLLEPYQDELKLIRYDARHVDIMEKHVNKAQAIRRLADSLGIAMEDVMAIGDGDNDVEMLNEVGIGVAVANAKEPLKAVADYVCQQPYTMGVIEAVRRFCLNGEGENA